MQNFTTDLRKDLLEKNLIYLPAGNAKFTLVDVEDIGKVGTRILSNPKITTILRMTSLLKIFEVSADGRLFK
jgi:uncharacterized protein YbjT (DUF2867 family)